MGRPEFAEGFLVLFDSCRVLESVSDQNFDDFLERSGASAVSGFAKVAGWLTQHRGRHGVVPPSIALDAMFFSSIMEKDIRLDLLRGDKQRRLHEGRIIATWHRNFKNASRSVVLAFVSPESENSFPRLW